MFIILNKLLKGLVNKNELKYIVDKIQNLLNNKSDNLHTHLLDELEESDNYKLLTNKNKEHIDMLLSNGAGKKYLSDNGKYKELNIVSKWSEILTKPFENINTQHFNNINNNLSLVYPTIKCTKVEYEQLNIANMIDDNTIYIITDDNNDIETGGSGSGNGNGENTGDVCSTNIIQKTKLNVKLNDTFDLLTTENDIINENPIIIQCFKHEDGQTDIIEIIKNFDNSDESNFYYNKNTVEFGNGMKIKNSWVYNFAVSESGLYESGLINKNDFVTNIVEMRNV